MEKTLIFGHKNPDTDTICSAICYAYLKEQLGEAVEPVRLGEVNKETAYALHYFNVDTPRLVTSVTDGANVILVDHNEFQQSVDNIENANILEVIDHHRVANFETKDPLYFRAEPVGCTATILNKLFKENNIKIPEHIAGLLVSAIISDSLLFKSPTCTEEDVKAAEALAQIAKIDLNTYGLDMLKAGADLSDKPVSEWISMDAKEFTMNGQKVEIAQVNTVDTNSIYEKQAELEREITRAIDEKGLSLFLLVVTDILNNDSEVLALGTEQNKVEAAFNVQLKSNRALLTDVVSRKKQIVPPVTEAFNE